MGLGLIATGYMYRRWKLLISEYNIVGFGLGTSNSFLAWTIFSMQIWTRCIAIMNSEHGAPLAEPCSVLYFWSVFMVTMVQVLIFPKNINKEKLAKLDAGCDHKVSKHPLVRQWKLSFWLQIWNQYFCPYYPWSSGTTITNFYSPVLVSCLQAWSTRADFLCLHPPSSSSSSLSGYIVK